MDSAKVRKNFSEFFKWGRQRVITQQEALEESSSWLEKISNGWANASAPWHVLQAEAIIAGAYATYANAVASYEKG
jgi:hypothetical protein